MKRSLLTVALLIAGGLASADPILYARPCPSTPCTLPGWLWEYTFTDPTADGSWMTTGVLADSHMGNAPFGNNVGGYGPDPGYFDYQTFWPAGSDDAAQDDLWVRTQIDLTGFSLSSVAFNLGVDNGFKLYVNGVAVALANQPGYTWRWEYGGSLAPFVHPGVNYVALALEDHGLLTAFDMEITGTPLSATPVPEPGTLLLIGSGISALALRRGKAR